MLIYQRVYIYIYYMGLSENWEPPTGIQLGVLMTVILLFFFNSNWWFSVTSILGFYQATLCSVFFFLFSPNMLQKQPFHQTVLFVASKTPWITRPNDSTATSCGSSRWSQERGSQWEMALVLLRSAPEPDVICSSVHFIVAHLRRGTNEHIMCIYIYIYIII